MSDGEEDHVIEMIPGVKKGSFKRKKISMSSLAKQMNKLKYVSRKTLLCPKDYQRSVNLRNPGEDSCIYHFLSIESARLLIYRFPCEFFYLFTSR